MNPSYTQFKFPQIKVQRWQKIFHKRMPPEAVDLVSRLLQSSHLWSTSLEVDDLRDPNIRHGRFLPLLFKPHD